MLRRSILSTAGSSRVGLRYASGKQSRKSEAGPSSRTDAIHESIVSEAEPAIPPLHRPLGVDLAPISGPKTYYKVIDKFYDAERQKAERSMLLKEASHGYFHDYNKTKRDPNGKQWIAPKVLIREDMAKYFPNVAGTDLNGKATNTTDLLTGKTSLVSILSTRLSEEHVETFTQPVLADQGDNPDFNYVRINHQENLLKAGLLALSASGLKRTIDQESWSKYLMSRGKWSELDVTDPMGIENKIVGYLYLVDANCKIRWAASGAATEGEIQSLRSAVAVLLERQKKGLTAPASSTA